MTLLIVPVALANAWLFSQLLGWWRVGLPMTDWANIASLPADPYLDQAYRWSPLAAPIWVTFVVPLGLTLWQLLHFAVLVLLPWPVALLTLVSAPFWFDVANGQVMTFTLVLAWLALDGIREPKATIEREVQVEIGSVEAVAHQRRLWQGRAATVGFVVLAVLVPRPLMLPVLGWLLWKRPEARWAFVAISVLVIGHAVLSGLMGEWIGRLLFASGEIATDNNLGPSRLIGPVWIPIGLALAAVLTWKGRLGFASLAAAPYLFHYYYLMGLLELRDRGVDRGSIIRDPIAGGTVVQHVDPHGLAP